MKEELILYMNEEKYEQKKNDKFQKTIKKRITNSH